MIDVLVDTGVRVGHVAVSVRVGPGFRRTARVALRFARRYADRVTVLVISDGDLDHLDTACRQLASILWQTWKQGASDVEVLIRGSNLERALRELGRYAAPDLVLIAQGAGAEEITQVGPYPVKMIAA